MTFSLTGHDPIPNDGSGRVLITDIRLSTDDNDALLCRSERDNIGIPDWYLDPTEMSTNDDDRIAQVCASKTMLNG